MAIDHELNDEIARIATRFLAARFPMHPANPPMAQTSLRSAWTELLALGWGHILATREGGAAFAASQIEALFKAWGANPAPGPAHDMLVAMPTLYALLAPESRAALDPFLAGDKLLSLARFSETADMRIDPDCWNGATVGAGRLTGSKTLVEAAAIADAFLVTARADDQPVLALMAAADNTGIITALKSPDRSSHAALVQFNGPVTLLARGERAIGIDAAVARLARLATVAELAGMARVALTLSVDYAKVRSQFGRTIGSFQAVKHLLAEAQLHVHALECVSLRLAEDMEGGLPDEQASTDAKRALCYASRAAQTVFDLALQVHGGIGFTIEYGLSWYYNRLGSLWGRWGDPATLALELGRLRLDGHAKEDQAHAATTTSAPREAA